jgi:ABC-type Fe3+/spermidine/putrescine transport system ATPase subunit
MPAAAAVTTASEWEVVEQRFLEVKRLSVGYGGPPVLKDVSLSVAKGEFVALLGSSGCGKTTLLRTIAGFARPISGAILAGGRDITRLPPDRREMALVFQSYALWPHMTVRQNIGYGLKLRRVPRDKADRRIDELLATLGLEGLGERNVTALSGGQRQRVALGRALAIDPRILLLDEPLSNLDARIRQTVRHEIRALQKRLGITAIHVTHDREEAMVMADRIVILNRGQVEQLGPPEEVYNRPRSPFVARFMGAENVVELLAERPGGRVEIRAGSHNLPAAWCGSDSLPQGRDLRVLAFFRSEAARLSEEAPGDCQPSSDELILTGRVTQVSYPGGTWRHAVTVGGSELQVDSPVQFRPSAPVRVCVPSEAVFLFPWSSDADGSSAPTEAVE